MSKMEVEWTQGILRFDPYYDSHGYKTYHGVCTLTIDQEEAVVKGAMGRVHRHEVMKLLRSIGVKRVSWERKGQTSSNRYTYSTRRKDMKEHSGSFELSCVVKMEGEEVQNFHFRQERLSYHDLLKFQQMSKLAVDEMGNEMVSMGEERAKRKGRGKK